jgi:hypothetical protein
MVDFYEAQQHFMIAQTGILTTNGFCRQTDGSFA